MTHQLPFSPLRIIGVDPGSQIVGYAVIEERKPNPINPKDFKIITAGAIKARPTLGSTERIGYLHEALHGLAEEWKPQICIIEQSFMGINAGSSLRLGEARGSLMSAMHRLGIPIYQVTPTRVKKTITGKGSATKQEVALCLKALLGFELGKLPYDVSDAVAIALYHGMSYASAKIANPRESIRAPL
jgi:crossover junction endodeoxyribonuclease RuvC